MDSNASPSELERALARPDANKLIRQLYDFAVYHASGGGDWPEDKAVDFDEIVNSGFEDPEKSLAYTIIAAVRSDDPSFIGLIACLSLEDILENPSDELLERVVAEAKRSARFRWLLSNPYKIAIAERAWAAIEQFRITGPHEEPASDTLPPRDAV